MKPFHVSVETVFHDGSRGQPFRALAREEDGSPLLLTASQALGLMEGDEVSGMGILQMPDRDRIPETLTVAGPGVLTVLRRDSRPDTRNPLLQWAVATFDAVAQSGSLTVLEPEKIRVPVAADRGRRHLRDLLDGVGTREGMGRMLAAVRRQLEQQLPLGFQSIVTTDMAGQILLSSGQAYPLSLRETPHEYGKHVVVIPYAPYRTGSTEFQDKTGLPIHSFQLRRIVDAGERHLRSLAHEMAHAVQDQYGFAYPAREDSAANRAVKNRSEGFADAFAIYALVQRGAVEAAEQLAAWREAGLIAMPAALCTGRSCRAALADARDLAARGLLADMRGEALLRAAAATVQREALQPAELATLDAMRERLFAASGIALDGKGRVLPQDAVRALEAFRTGAAAQLGETSLQPLLAATLAAVDDQAHAPTAGFDTVTPAMRADYARDLASCADWLRRFGHPQAEQTLLLREVIAHTQLDGRTLRPVGQLSPLAVARVRQLHRADCRLQRTQRAGAGEPQLARALRIGGSRPRYPVLSAALALPPAARLGRLHHLLTVLHEGSRRAVPTAEPVLRRAAAEALQVAYAVRLDADCWALAQMRLPAAARMSIDDLMEGSREERILRLRQEAGALGPILRSWPRLGNDNGDRLPHRPHKLMMH